jgi:hypothetical protein
MTEDTATRNLRTSLRRKRRRANPMAEFDALPPAARRWLAQAAMPWSAASVRRAWRRALKTSGGCEVAAAQMLSATEQARLAKDAAQIWGQGHPHAQQSRA